MAAEAEIEVFTVELLPVGEGDCIWVEWGEPSSPCRMLIDAGRGRGLDRLPEALQERIEELGAGDRTFELVVATHIDVDHVHGLVPLFASPPKGFRAKEVWFNGRRHLPSDEPSDKLGYRDGNRLSKALGDNAPEAWNRGWSHKFRGAVVVPDPPEPLPVRVVGGGMEIVLLSPTLDALRRLGTVWPEVVKTAGLEGKSKPVHCGDLLGVRDPGTALRRLATMTEDDSDPSPSNRSSIAFLATYEKRTVLFAADAHADVLVAGLERVKRKQSVHVDVCKVPHHGSRQNVKPALLAMLDCHTWLVSTNGSKYFHPDRRAMARILAIGGGQRLVFNYLRPQTKEYGLYSVKREFRSNAHYPPSKRGGIRVDVVAPGGPQVLD